MTRLRELLERVRPMPRLAVAAVWTIAKALGPRVVRSTRRVLALFGIAVSIGLVLAGLTLIYLPAGLIGGGLTGFALLTFDSRNVRRLTWPR